MKVACCVLKSCGGNISWHLWNPSTCPTCGLSNIMRKGNSYNQNQLNCLFIYTFLKYLICVYCIVIIIIIIIIDSFIIGPTAGHESLLRRLFKPKFVRSCSAGLTLYMFSKGCEPSTCRFCQVLLTHGHIVQRLMF